MFGLKVKVPGRAVTEKQVAQVPNPKPVGLFTLMVRGPIAAPAPMFTVIVIWVLLSTVVPMTVTPLPGLGTVAPGRKKFPVMTKVWSVAPWPRVLGLTEVTTGPVATV
jgi:hypothetical protein